MKLNKLKVLTMVYKLINNFNDLKTTWFYLFYIVIQTLIFSMGCYGQSLYYAYCVYYVYCEVMKNLFINFYSTYNTKRKIYVLLYLFIYW